MKGIFLQRYKEMYDIYQDEAYENRLMLLGEVIIEFREECFQGGVSPYSKNSGNEFFESSKCLCSIYRAFIFDDTGSIVSNKINTKYQLLLLQNLGTHFGEPAKIEHSDCMGCPFSEEHVGYFDISIDFEKIDKILSAFALASSDATDIFNDNYLISHYKRIYDVYLECCEEIIFSLYSFLGSKPVLASNTFPELLTQQDDVFVDSNGTMMVGFDLSTLKKVIHKFLRASRYPVRFVNVNRFVFGVEYCFVDSTKTKSVINAEYIKQAQILLRRLNMEELCFTKCQMSPYYVLLKNYDDNFWAVIPLYQGEQEEFLLKERENIKTLYENVQAMLPSHLAFTEYDYSKLSNSIFEDMCRDLLDEMGFKNIKQRGKTNAPDGGIDIEADLFIETALDRRTEHWIFQCKHTKAQVDRKDLGEVRELLDDFNAARYGLFYSGVFSPQTIDRLKNLNAHYWGQGELNIELRKHKRTALRYFGI